MPKNSEQGHSGAWADRIGRKLRLLADRHKAEPKFKVGDAVKAAHGLSGIGTIEEIDLTHNCIFYGVRFNMNDKRWLFESALQTAPEQ